MKTEMKIVIGLLAVIAGFIIVLGAPNTNALRDPKNPKPVLSPVVAGLLLFISIIVLEVRKTSEFLYFQF